MPNGILIEEFHVEVFVPDRLTPVGSRSIRRVLTSQRFRVALTKAIRDLFVRYRSLGKTRIKVTV